MQTKQLLERISQLEFVNDQIVAELREVDRLLRAIGFSEGLKSVKTAAQEIYTQERQVYDDYEGGEFL